jgi:hypothetical protein
LQRHSLATTRLRRILASIAVTVLTLTGVSLAASASATPPPFTISGQVTSLVGYPAGTAQVAVGYYTAGAWQYSSNVNVGVDGMYSVDATDGPGEYDLYFTVVDNSAPFLGTFSDGSLHEPDGTTATNPGVINATNVTDIPGIDVALVAAGFITGTVTAKGLPVVGDDVQAADTITGDEFDATAPTDSTGKYSIKVAAGDAMAVGIGTDPNNFPQQYSGYSFGTNGYDPVTVGAGATTSGIDFVLNPLNGSLFLQLDVKDPSKQVLDNVASHLYVIDDHGNVAQTANVNIAGGFGILIASTPGEYEFEFTNASGARLAIKSYDLSIPDQGNGNGNGNGNGSVDSGSITPPDPCIADSGEVTQANLDAQPGYGPLVVEFTFALDPDLTICNATPSTPTAPTKHHALIFAGSTTTTVATPTPTPTPTPTETPSSSPSPSPSASSTPSPKVTPPGDGLPWWVWLLIVVGILILAGIAFALFRRR